MLGLSTSELSNHLQKIIGESPNLVHQKGDPYRTKGSVPNVLSERIFSRFCGRAKSGFFWPQIGRGTRAAERGANRTGLCEQFGLEAKPAVARFRFSIAGPA